MKVITGEERRRRWSDEQRARILAAIAEPGAVVADVARREDVCTSLVYKWRRAAQRGEGSATCGFSPVIIEAASRGPATVTSARNVTAGVVEVDLGTARVKIGADAPPAVIAATLKALRR